MTHRSSELVTAERAIRRHRCSVYRGGPRKIAAGAWAEAAAEGEVVGVVGVLTPRTEHHVDPAFGYAGVVVTRGKENRVREAVTSHHAPGAAGWVARSTHRSSRRPPRYDSSVSSTARSSHSDLRYL